MLMLSDLGMHATGNETERESTHLDQFTGGVYWDLQMFALGTVGKNRPGYSVCFGEAEFFVGFNEQERNLGYDLRLVWLMLALARRIDKLLR